MTEQEAAQVVACPSEQSFHSLPSQDGTEVFYRLTHFLDDEGLPTGEGVVEQRETIHHASSVEHKYRATNADYSAFLRTLKAREAERKDYHAELTHGEMSEADVEAAERHYEDVKDFQPESSDAPTETEEE